MDPKRNNNDSLSIERIIQAPRALVFEAWTNAEALPHWFAPKDCSIEFKTLEIREGGKYHSCLYNPAFGDCWCMGEYLEIKAPEKLVYTALISDENGNALDPVSAGMDPAWPKETIVTVLFEEYEGKTKLILHQTAPETLARETGAYPSWLEMLDRMELELEKKIVKNNQQ